MPAKTNLTGILDKIHEESEGSEIVIDRIVTSLKHRGYGPMLLMPAIFNLLPTGAIPGVPSFMGLIIIFISAQMIIGKKTPYVPKRLRNIEIKKKKFEKSRKFLSPYTKKIDHYLKPRFRFLSSNFASRFIGASCVTLGMTMPALGLIPFAADIPAFVVALYALGLSTRDGVVIMIAITANTGALVAIYFILQNLLAG